MIYCFLKKYDKAESDVTKAVERDPHNKVYKKNLKKIGKRMRNDKINKNDKNDKMERLTNT